MAIRNPYSARTVVGEGYSRQISLPSAVLSEHNASVGQQVPASYEPDAGTIELFADEYGMQLKLVGVGASAGVTIPAAIRDRHGIERGDVLFVECIGGSALVHLSD